jgi:GNAT superfamily N-acetyltransferase
VRLWLHAYLLEHVEWWLQARGLDGDAAAVVDERGLVDRDWAELTAAAEADFVEVAERDGAAVGVVSAAVREDRHLRVESGVLQWLAVDPAARGQGVARALVARAGAWFDARGVSAEVFVTAANTAAVRAYADAGFAAIDTRMIRRRMT